MGNTVKTTVLLASLSGLLLVMGDLLGGRSGLIVALGFAVVMNIGSYWFSDKLVLAMYKAQPVGPEHPLHQIVQRLSQRAGLPMPRVYIIPDASPNAFATGRNPDHAAVAATEGILRLLSEDELAGVVAHELAHVKHRDILISSVAATIAAAIMFTAHMARYAAMFGGGRSSDDREGGSNPIALLATVILAPVAAMLIQSAISRSREFAADAGGAEICGNPESLASALLRLEQGAAAMPMQVNQAAEPLYIVKPFKGGGIAGLFSTHPPVEERVRRLRQMRPTLA